MRCFNFIDNQSLVGNLLIIINILDLLNSKNRIFWSMVLPEHILNKYSFSLKTINASI